MTERFDAALLAIVDQAPASFQPKVRRDLAALRAAGIDSLDGLYRLVHASEQPRRLRVLGCWLLAQLRDEGAASVLLDVLHDPDGHLAWEAAKALAAIGARRVVPALREVLLESPEADRRAAVAFVLGRLADPRAASALVQALSDPAGPVVRGPAAEALAHCGDERAVAPLRAALADRAPEVRYWAAYALGELGATEAGPDLERLANDSDEVPGWGTVGAAAREAAARLRSARRHARR